jgi:putative salt-induced outer membrane protein YdiY
MTKDDITLADLKANVNKISTRRSERYQYARSKGFSATEANYLSGRTVETIDRLAAERDAQSSK